MQIHHVKTELIAGFNKKSASCWTAIFTSGFANILVSPCTNAQYEHCEPLHQAMLRASSKRQSPGRAGRTNAHAGLDGRKNLLFQGGVGTAAVAKGNRGACLHGLRLFYFGLEKDRSGVFEALVNSDGFIQLALPG
jgi:hypothetical protein